MDEPTAPDPRRRSIEEERARAERLRRLLEEESMRSVGETTRDRIAAGWWSARPQGRTRGRGRLR